MARGLAIALVALALATLAWVLAGAAAGDSVLARSDDAAAGRRPLGPMTPAESEAALAALERARGGSGREALASDVGTDPALELAAAEESAEKDPPQLVGRIVDSQQQPIAGVRVFTATGWVQTFPLELEELRQIASWMQRVETATDADGQFAIEKGLSAGQELAVHAIAPGFAPLRVDGLMLRLPAPTDVGELVMRPGRIARGRVVTRSGAPIADAKVLLAVIEDQQGFRLSSPSRGVPLATSDADGRFTVDRLEQGPFTLLVEAPERLVATVNGVASDRPLEDLVVVLDAGASIHGKLTGLEARESDPSRGGEPLPELRVEARPGKPDNSQVEGLDRAFKGARTSAVDAEGAFAVTGLVDGLPYTLIVSEKQEDGRWSRCHEVAALEASPGTRGVQLRWQAKRSLVMRVVDDETGAPLESFLAFYLVGDNFVEDRLRPLNVAPDKWEPLLEHPGGVVTFASLGSGDAPVSVRLRAVGYEQTTLERIRVKRDGVTEHGDVRMKRAPTIRVTVKDGETSAPIEGARVYMAPSSEDWFTGWVQRAQPGWSQAKGSYGETNAEGIAVLASLPGKRVKVAAVSTKHVPSESVDLHLSESGGDEASLQLYKGGSVLVRVVRPSGAPAEGVRVQCRAAQKDLQGRRVSQPELVTDAAGEARFERLPPQRHEVSATGPDGGQSASAWRSVQIAAGTEATVTLDAPSVGTLTGMVLEAGVGLSRASLALESATQGSNRYGMNYGWYGGGPSPSHTESRADGSYRLGPLAAGEYVLVVRHGSRAMAMRFPVRLMEGANRLDVRLDVALIEGQVVDMDGAPFNGLGVHIQSTEGDLSGGTQSISLREGSTGEMEWDWNYRSLDSTSTRGEGEFRFQGVAIGTPLRLVISGTYVEPITMPLSDFAAGELRNLGTIRARAAGAIRVKVGGSGRDRVKLVPHWLGSPDDAPSQMISSSRRGSTAMLQSLRPGPYRLEVQDQAGNKLEEREIEVRVLETLRIDVL